MVIVHDCAFWVLTAKPGVFPNWTLTPAQLVYIQVRSIQSYNRSKNNELIKWNCSYRWNEIMQKHESLFSFSHDWWAIFIVEAGFVPEHNLWFHIGHLRAKKSLLDFDPPKRVITYRRTLYEGDINRLKSYMQFCNCYKNYTYNYYHKGSALQDSEVIFWILYATTCTFSLCMVHGRSAPRQWVGAARLVLPPWARDYIVRKYT